MKFGKALEALKKGRGIRRTDWRVDKGIVLVPGSDIVVEKGRPLAQLYPVGSEIKYLPHIDVNQHGEISAWQPTHEDLLAEDWTIDQQGD